MSHFSDWLHEEDLRRFQARRGDPAFNTLWEAMAILVALRCWAPRFTHDAAATARSDSHGSLSAMAKLSSPSPSLNLVMAELALDASESPCGLTPVDVLVHIPGVNNTVADPLSRAYAPSPLASPSELARSVPETPPFRDIASWRTRRDPFRRSNQALEAALDALGGRPPPAGWTTSRRSRLTASMPRVGRGRRRTARGSGPSFSSSPALPEDTLIGMTMQPMTGGEDAGAVRAAISAGIARRSDQRALRFRPQGGAPSSGSRGPPPAPEQLERGRSMEPPELPRSRSRRRKRHHRRRHRSAERPSPQRDFSLHSAPDAAREQCLVAKSRPHEPPLRRAPSELRSKWTQWAQWEAPLQPPPGSWTGRAVSDYAEEWPVEWLVPEAGLRVPVTPDAAPAEGDRVARAISQAPERAPPVAPPAECEYPEEWDVSDYFEATAGPGDADRDPSPGAPGPPVRRDRNPLASASRSVRRKSHFSMRDPRHEGPRLLTWFGGGEICRQWNRGACAPTREGPEGHYGVCKHWRHHVCSQCGSTDHPAISCSTPEADWPPKQ